jgi:hypothetical protein
VEAAASALTFDLDGIPLIVADRKTLIRTKRMARPSDAADREAPGDDTDRPFPF